MTIQSSSNEQRADSPTAPFEHLCQITNDYGGETRLVRVAGRLDWVTARALRDLLRDHCSDSAVVVDLGAVTSMDSVGVGILLAATARFKERGQRMAVVVADPFLVEVLCSTGLPAVVPVAASEEEALRSLNSAPE
jgi:stage II sporulation protein AA (anti-sigma F factor antagonist)